MLSSTAVGLSSDTDLLDAAWFRSPTWLDDLAATVLPEDWDDEGSGRHPILFNYLRYTFRRQLELGNWREVHAPAGESTSAMNTGLLSRNYEPVYAVFEPNRNPDRQPWVLTDWAPPSSPRLREFDLDELPAAEYFSDLGEAVFDPGLRVVADIDRIVHDNVDRYPPELQANEYLRSGMLQRAISLAAAKAKANWRTAVPQYYWPQGPTEPGRVQLLLPLSLLDANHVDLALVIDRDPPYSERTEGDHQSHPACYRAYTVLPIGWAYRNARLITRPDSYWLDLNTRRLLGAADPDNYSQGYWRPTSYDDWCPVCGSQTGCFMKIDNQTVLCRMKPSDTEVPTSSVPGVGVAELWAHTASWTDAPHADQASKGSSS